MPVPNVAYRVEIAWDSTWLTPAASRVWTDVSNYVELQDGISIGYGRSDEVSTADANTLTLTLDNSDGRFTHGNTASPYYPNVKIGKPIRVTALVGGTEYIRFVGLVDEWPVAWPGGSASFATATITASSRLSRLGIGTPILSKVDEVHLGLAPEHYWRLTEATGPSLGSDAGSDPAAMVATLGSPAFGVGSDGEPTFDLDGRPGVHLIGQGNGNAEREPTIAADLPTPITIGPGAPGGVTLSLFVRVTNPNDPNVFTYGRLASLVDRTTWSGAITDREVEIDLLGGGYNDGTGSTYGAGWPADPAVDGAIHHMAVTVSCDGANLTATGYFDGASAGAQTEPAVTLTLNRLRIAAPAYSALVGRVAVWDRVLSAAEIGDLAGSGLNGLAGDTTDERLARYAAWARIPAAEVVTTPSAITLGGLTADSGQVEDLMRSVETTEAGVLYDDREGFLVLAPRNARYHSPIALTVAFTDDLVANYEPKVDRQGLANVGTGKGPNGDEVTYDDPTSREDYGDAGYSVETSALDPDEPLQLIAWQVNKYADPLPRVPAPVLSVIDFLNTINLGALLSLDVGSKVRLTNAPAQAPSATAADYFVEGYSEEMAPGEWRISPNLTPVTLEDDVLVLNSGTDGLLDTNVLAL
ncbi:LamG-like jellyroll fold domain-containing protein [Nocardioides sp. J54]|uniref:LamG-like jellyroll fold domain-containing protein n=1 Tax=Nocardioides sp. J54 TaxID=935866 RepID=UPI000490361A|nr:LamG-like jellyroll fold domain-containing protein [Nocardioides sp. J54]